MPKNNDLSAVAAVSASTNGEAINNNPVSEAKKPVANEPLAVSNIQVSEGTAKYIRLKAQLSDLWNDLYEAIEKDYGQGAQKAFDEKLYPLLCGIDKEIESYLMSSICETMGEKANTNII